MKINYDRMDSICVQTKNYSVKISGEIVNGSETDYNYA